MLFLSLTVFAILYGYCHAFCAKQEDILFLIDGSDSVGSSNFEDVKKFLKMLASEMKFGPGETHFGVIQFDNDAYTEIPLQPFDSAGQVDREIDKIKYSDGGTDIRYALEHAIKELQNSEYDRPDVPNTIVTITDGKSSRDVRPPARQMRAWGWRTFAIGVTDSVDAEELLNVAGSQTRVFRVQNFTSLDQRLTDAILSLACKDTDPDKRPDPCKPNPCTHGECFAKSNDSYRCECADGYKGITCNEKEGDPCDPSPCDHGVCSPNTGGGYSCNCEKGYKGETCSQQVSCQMVKHKDRRGWDVKWVSHVADAQACCDRCIDMQGCLAFSYISRNSPFLAGKCWLKFKVPSIGEPHRSIKPYITCGVVG